VNDNKLLNDNVIIKINSGERNERLPGKNTKEFYDDTPLIYFILKTLTQVKEINQIYVFCSDEKIKDYLIDGVHLIKRDKYLDITAATTPDIIEQFMKKVMLIFMYYLMQDPHL
jgi:spore coat polysaccharide biosynthesis protein SpsF (cytidylyltransferase family)